MCYSVYKCSYTRCINVLDTYGSIVSIFVRVIHTLDMKYTTLAQEMEDYRRATAKQTRFLRSTPSDSSSGSTAQPAPAQSAAADQRLQTVQPRRGRKPIGHGSAPAPQAALSEPSGLSARERDQLNSVLQHEFAANTLKSYRGQWNGFASWAQARRVSSLPAAPTQVAAYLAERIEDQQRKPATLRVSASAITFVHRAAGLPNPCSSEQVKRTLRGAGRKLGRAQRQARPLTDAALDQIRLSACQPRRSRGGRREHVQTARERGLCDIALISLMRDAMLRVSEAAALTWRDLERMTDGTGRLLIRRSKTDAEGAGAILYISLETMAALECLRGPAELHERLFRLRPNQIANRIRQAAAAAGLGAGFSGHSPRVGMAQDLARAGIELPSLMTAGRWRDSAMPALYTRNESAARGAVAQYYDRRRRQPG